MTKARGMTASGGKVTSGHKMMQRGPARLLLMIEHQEIINAKTIRGRQVRVEKPLGKDSGSKGSPGDYWGSPSS